MRKNNVPFMLFVLMVSIAICIQAHAQVSAVKEGKSWQARRELADAAAGRRKDIIYHEEKVPDYTLPDPLVMTDGTKVTNAGMWLSLIHI